MDGFEARDVVKLAGARQLRTRWILGDGWLTDAFDFESVNYQFAPCA